jgi:hypothetical protein
MRLRWSFGVVLGLALALTAAVALAAPRPGSWKGTNDQVPAQPLTFQVSKGSQYVLNFQPAFIVTCTKKGRPKKTVGITSDAKTNIAIHHNAFQLRASRAKIHNGPSVYGSGTESIYGTFASKHSALGTYSLTFTFNKSAPKGLTGYHCRTGKVHWTAEHV